MPSRRPRPARPARDSRAEILAAAAAEFAARGYAATTVDRIARRARINKAMIYYHFHSKQDLYRRILRDMFVAVGERLREIEASPRTPTEKIDAFVAAIVHEGEARPPFARIWLREVAEGAPHLDAETLRRMQAVPLLVRSLIAEGQAAGAFRDIHPLLAHFSMVGPVLLYLAGAELRAEVARRKLLDTAGTDIDAFIRHQQQAARRLLCKD